MPLGFCKGVQEAIALALKAQEEHKDKKVYLLGGIIHNQEAIDMLEGKGLILLDERKKSLSEHLEGIEEGQVVVFSAHGHDKKLDAIAKRKGLIVYDATCSFVEDNLQEALSIGKERPIIYIGVAAHLEAEGFMANYPDAAFYDAKSDAFDPSKVKGDDPYIITQTTLSFLEVARAHRKILSLFPKASIGRERCLSTSIRQKAIMELPSSVEAVVVLGSAYSNNSVKLAEIATSRGFPTYLVRDLDSLKALSLSKYREIALASGASTFLETCRACQSYLESL